MRTGQVPGVLMIIAMAILVVALSLQIVKNESARDDLEASTSPVFIILFPLASAFKLVGEYALVRDAVRHKEHVLVAASQTIGIVVIIAGYSAWIFQYASVQSSDSAVAGYYVAGSVLVLFAAVFGVIVVCVLSPRKKNRTQPDTELDTFKTSTRRRLQDYDSSEEEPAENDSFL